MQLQPNDTPRLDRFRHVMPFGTEIRDGRVRFKLFAPLQRDVRIDLDGLDEPLPMTDLGDGWHELTTAARPGTRYRFLTADGRPFPDPASRFQPLDASGPSEIVDPEAYRWRHTTWSPGPWSQQVVYELHIGTFTPEGTFRAAIDKLDALVELGVTTLELMPVAEFPGRWNWGYDCALLYAPDHSYGRPEDFKAFVDAAHEKGLAVILDVIYNHFGPESNPLPDLVAGLFTERHHTPWGAAINYDGARSRNIREFAIHNALFWLEEYRLDGLRLDAVHAIIDDSPTHLLVELAKRARVASIDREIYLVVENDENRASLLERDEHGRPALYDAQWNDDVHHSLHTAATGEKGGYLVDYLNDVATLARGLAEGFGFQGAPMQSRGCTRGEPCAHLPPSAFMSFLQNHDQIGNRALGERIDALVAPEPLSALSAIYLLLPQVPLLFMGEEWNAPQPFLYFCDFEGELAEAVRSGRRNEFAKFPGFSDPEQRARIPDPIARDTFVASKLRWEDRDRPDNRAWLERYRRLLRIRRQEIAPLLPKITSGGRYAIHGATAVSVTWAAGEHELLLVANVAGEPAPVPPPTGRELWLEGERRPDGRGSAWYVRWALA
jgi:malto-oligosyltrehalose trehalohydrolase